MMAACGPRLRMTSVTRARPPAAGCHSAQTRVHIPSLINTGSPAQSWGAPVEAPVSGGVLTRAGTRKALPPASSTLTCRAPATWPGHSASFCQLQLILAMFLPLLMRHSLLGTAHRCRISDSMARTSSRRTLVHATASNGGEQLL